MLVRQLMLLVNIAIFAVVLGLSIGLSGTPYASYLFYILLIWIVASLFIYRLPVMNRRIGGGPAPAPPGPGAMAGAPLPSSGGAEFGFCIHCGTTVPPGTPICPTCGRPTSS